MSGPMNSIGLFSFFPHKSELRIAICIIFHTLSGPVWSTKIAKLLKSAMSN